MLRTKPKPRTAARDRSDEFASFSPRIVTRAVMARIDKTTPSVAPHQHAKESRRVVQSIRDSARDEQCLMMLPGCPNNRAMTIWSHNRHQRAGKGKGIKALDMLGAYACTHCDAIYDGQAMLPEGWTRDAVELRWYAAHDKSVVLLAKKGLL